MIQSNVPLIGLSTRPQDAEGRYALSARYVEFVRRAGGHPVLLPPGEPHFETLLKRLDGVILSGGGDIDPSLYGGFSHKEIYGVDIGRDQSEIFGVKYAIESRLPLLGICRGIQVINVALGGTLMEHLPDHVGESVLHRFPEKKESIHLVRIAPGSFVQKIFGQEELDVPSCHHQAIHTLASPLKGVAYAPDRIIEAVEIPEHPFFIGVQWHPELSDDPLQQKLFDAFIKAASATRLS